MVSAKLVPRNAISASTWDQFIDRSPQRAIYFQSWYLDIICPGWQAVIASEKDTWQAVLPVNICRKALVPYALQPLGAQHLGMLFHPNTEVRNRPQHRKKILIQETIRVLKEHVKLFNQNFHPAFDYFLPFHWTGFQVTPRFTYVLSLKEDLETMEGRYANSIHYDIEKAQRKGLRCANSTAIGPLIRLCRLQGYYPPALLDKLPALWNAIAARDIGKLLYVYDTAGEVVCGALFLRDDDTLTYLMASTAREFKSSGANSLLLSEALRAAKQQTGLTLFDFEGSMVESIEHYFRGFGAKPKVYYNIQRNDLPLIHRLAYLAKQRLGQEHSMKSPH